MTGPQTDKSGQIVATPKPKDAAAAMVALIEKMRPEMARALPRHVTPDRMARIVLTAVRTNPKLALCEPGSFLACVMSLSQLGLEPNTPLGHAYLIPRNNRKRGNVECTLIVGYQGMIDLSLRSGLVAQVYAYAVREGDEFEYRLGTDRWVKHVPSEDPEREGKRITHAYAVARLKNGEVQFEVLTIAQVEARRKRSTSGSDGPWVTDYEAMVLKSTVRALWRWMPKSAEMARAELLEVATDTGRGVLAGADETVTALLGAHGLGGDAEATEAPEGPEGQPGARAEAEGAKDAPAVPAEGALPSMNEIAEVDRLAVELNMTSSERNQLLIRHGGDFKKALAELQAVGR